MKWCTACILKLDLWYLSEIFLFFEIYENTQCIVHVRPKVGPKVGHALTRLTLGTQNVGHSSQLLDPNCLQTLMAGRKGREREREEKKRERER